MKGRIKYLNNYSSKDRKYVIYWMQASQRVDYNHALEYAITRANDLDKPLVVYFGLTDQFPDANIRHYKFMVEGLIEVKEKLTELGIKFVVVHTSPDEGAIALSNLAALMVVDRGYLKIQREWRLNVATAIDIPLIEVESNVVVPVEEVSTKEEYAASTIRRKITPLIEHYANHFDISEVAHKSIDDKLDVEQFDLTDLNKLNLDSSVSLGSYKGGISEARLHLESFIKTKINKYDELSNDPSLDCTSNMSPYLHFGQISPIEIYLKTRDLNSHSFLEELIIRRELAINFVYYNNNYDSYKSLPNWALTSLEKHLADNRPYLYSLDELEVGNTHDPYWNACQMEMVKTGKMHGYMRMYWGKKVIEWTSDYKVAYEYLVYLNNKYSLDGRDENGYAGIAWCFGKHDRPWKERPIFGMIRYMNDSGLKRKFAMDNYLDKISQLN